MRAKFSNQLSLILVFLSVLLLSHSQEAFAKKVSTGNPSSHPVSADLHIIGAEPGSPAVVEILSTIDDLVTASNQHKLEEVLQHYSPRFISGDNLNLVAIKKLISETWQTFPDIQYRTQTMEIRVSGDWATVESIDTATASAKADPTISTNSGKLNSRSRGLLYLHRTGKTWEITSDYTLFEMATITYGELSNVNLVLATPEQAFAGDLYTAKIKLDVPKGVLAIATISKEPLVYPQVKPKDRFRSMSADSNSLERIFQANTTNNNEIVTATVGLTQVNQDEEDRPTIKLNGIATVVKRVNVIPKSSYEGTDGKGDLVESSANGQVNLGQAKPTSDVPASVVPTTPPLEIPKSDVVPEKAPESPQVSPEATPPQETPATDDDGPESDGSNTDDSETTP